MLDEESNMVVCSGASFLEDKSINGAFLASDGGDDWGMVALMLEMGAATQKRCCWRGTSGKVG